MIQKAYDKLTMVRGREETKGSRKYFMRRRASKNVKRTRHETRVERTNDEIATRLFTHPHFAKKPMVAVVMCWRVRATLNRCGWDTLLGVFDNKKNLLKVFLVSSHVFEFPFTMFQLFNISCFCHVTRFKSQTHHPCLLLHRRSQASIP